MTDRKPVVGFNLSQIAACLGVSRQRAAQLRQKDPAFPVPVAICADSAIWLPEEVATYRDNRLLHAAKYNGTPKRWHGDRESEVSE